MKEPEDAREFLRHTLATLAYRAGKAVRGAPPEFADFKAGPTTRTPLEVLAHMGDLMDWALTMARDAQAWKDSPPFPWDREVARFFASLEAFDRYLASRSEVKRSLAQLFQGPVADALTHTGQLTMLRRLAEAPIKGENYSRAEIELGRVGADQAPPQREFD